MKFIVIRSISKLRQRKETLSIQDWMVWYVIPADNSYNIPYSFVVLPLLLSFIRFIVLVLFFSDGIDVVIVATVAVYVQLNDVLFTLCTWMEWH